MATKDITDIQVCIAVANYKKTQFADEQEYPIQYLMRTTGECFKVCLRALERADRRDLIDYGVSIALPWLTKKGMELIKEELDKEFYRQLLLLLLDTEFDSEKDYQLICSRVYGLEIVERKQLLTKDMLLEKSK